MTYLPNEPLEIHKIRRLVRDTSNDPAIEYFPDITYENVLAASLSWRHATIEMALSVAGKIEDSPTSLSSDSDSISWQLRTRQLYTLAERLTREIQVEEELLQDSSFGELVTFEIPHLTTGYTGSRKRHFHG